MKGKLFHLATFEPHLFGTTISHFVRPEGMNFTTKEGKAWRDAHGDLPILKADEYASILGAATALQQDAFLGPMLRAKGRAEVTVMAKHERTGLPLKMRADWLTEDVNGRAWILDAKSIASLDDFPWSARDFGYDTQSVFYTDTLALADVPNAGFLFAVVELEPPFEVRLETISAESQIAARELYERDLDRLAECSAADFWPRKYPEIGRLTIPRRGGEQREEIL